MKRIVPCLLFMLVGLSVLPEAEARTDRLMTYRQNQLWTGVLRFLRVDMGYRVIERDREAGYLLFEYQDGGRAHNASFEMITVIESGRRYVRTTLQIPNMPKYVEVVLLDKFERKLKTEYGDPPPATPVPPPSGTAGGQDSSQPTAAAGEEDADANDDDFDGSTEEEQ